MDIYGLTDNLGDVRKVCYAIDISVIEIIRQSNKSFNNGGIIVQIGFKLPAMIVLSSTM